MAQIGLCTLAEPAAGRLSGLSAKDTCGIPKC